MPKLAILFIGLILITVSMVGFSSLFQKKTKPEARLPERKQTMQVTSPVFTQEEQIPVDYSCDGENVNPPLAIANIPTGTQSLAIIVDDPDAPSGTWAHWLVWNISPSTREILEDSVPEGAILGTNDFKKMEYGGPCPPSGTHRYFFKVYALDTKLDLAEGASRGELDEAMDEHILDSAELIGLYSRKEKPQ